MTSAQRMAKGSDHAGVEKEIKRFRGSPRTVGSSGTASQSKSQCPVTSVNDQA